jgi:Uma2 family endonuclease
LTILREEAILGSPSLVVEVLSPSSVTIDSRGGAKYKRYAADVVPEYWVVDPRARIIDVYSDPDSKSDYRKHLVFKSECLAATLAGFALDVASLFA